MAGNTNNPNAPKTAAAAATGHWRQYVTSDTLQAVDLQGRNVVVVIDRVVRAEMTDRKDPKKAKGVLNVYFKGKRKPLVVKAELAGVISKLAGSTACAKWVGVAIEIYPTTVYAFGQNHEVVRISNRRPTADQAKAAGGRAPEPDPDPPDTDLEEDEFREFRVEDEQALTRNDVENALKKQGMIDETTQERRDRVADEADRRFEQAADRAADRASPMTAQEIREALERERKEHGRG
jgi:hypothetical protein